MKNVIGTSVYKLVKGLQSCQDTFFKSQEFCELEGELICEEKEGRLEYLVKIGAVKSKRYCSYN